MRSWFRSPSVRFRLTLWYVGAMVVVLAVYAASVYTVVSRTASQSLDDRLLEDFHWPAEMLDRLPDGTIAAYDEYTGETEVSPWLQVWSSDAKLLYSTWLAQRNPVPRADVLAARADGRIVTVSEIDPPMRILSGQSRIGGRPVVIQVARSELPMRYELRELLFVLLLGLPLAVVAAGLGGYSLARRALAPVNRIAERARSITAERLRDRLPVDNPNDELGRLASVFNETLTRLELSFEQMRRFTADASHELRTPLTAMRTVGEVGLRGRRDADAYRNIITSMLEEVDRLARLVDGLLILSRADNGEMTLSAEVIDLGDLAEEVAEQLGVLAEEKQQSLAVDRVRQPRTTGDRLVLRQAVFNLVDNALKYTPPGGQITVRVAESSGGAIIDVCDSGPGIPAELQLKIFDRFYRLDKARTRENGGTGLGLSIAKWAVQVNGGQLGLEKTGTSGSMFRIVLPAPLESYGQPQAGAVGIDEGDQVESLRSPVSSY